MKPYNWGTAVCSWFTLQIYICYRRRLTSIFLYSIRRNRNTSSEKKNFIAIKFRGIQPGNSRTNWQLSVSNRIYFYHEHETLKSTLFMKNRQYQLKQKRIKKKSYTTSPNKLCILVYIISTVYILVGCYIKTSGKQLWFGNAGSVGQDNNNMTRLNRTLFLKEVKVNNFRDFLGPCPKGKRWSQLLRPRCMTVNSTVRPPISCISWTKRAR